MIKLDKRLLIDGKSSEQISSSLQERLDMVASPSGHSTLLVPDGAANDTSYSKGTLNKQLLFYIDSLWYIFASLTTSLSMIRDPGT